MQHVPGRSPDKIVAVHLKVSGFVHGVSYRANMAWVANERGVRGWVRNLPDGTVEAVLEGEKPRVDAVVEWAKKGPPRAVVRGVEVKPVQVRYHRSFSIEP